MEGLKDSRLDLIFGLDIEEKKRALRLTVEKWRNRMRDAYEIASKTSAKEATRCKLSHDESTVQSCNQGVGSW